MPQHALAGLHAYCAKLGVRCGVPCRDWLRENVNIPVSLDVMDMSSSFGFQPTYRHPVKRSAASYLMQWQQACVVVAAPAWIRGGAACRQRLNRLQAEPQDHEVKSCNNPHSAMMCHCRPALFIRVECKAAPCTLQYCY